MDFKPSELSFNSRRSPVLGRRGMVATSQPLAVAAGLELLARGGNAADAAVATAAALNVTEPTSTGIGGDCFALYYDAATRQVTALNGSGRSPAALTLDRVRRAGIDEQLPPFHPFTITVPGACAGWADLVERHGQLSLGQALAPAIRLARDGFPVSPLTAYSWARGVEKQLRHAPGGKELTVDGRAPRPGELFSNPGLARTFQRVADDGPAGFYQGPIAEAIAATVQQAGGVLTAGDLATHRSLWQQPIHTTFGGLRVWECPPNGQGLAALLALNILEGFDLAATEPLSAQRLHLGIEAMRLAFADARWHIADPNQAPAPLDVLLSKEYAADRRRLIDPQRATMDHRRGSPPAHSDTVYLTVVDATGNACSFINSNYMGFGTGIVPAGWGFTLQNRGACFDLHDDHPNVLGPNKRPYHTIIPALLTHADNDDLFASLGVMGGFMQPQGHLQVTLALAVDQVDPQAALDRPRFCIDSGRAGGRIALEEGIPVSVMARLAEMGHPVMPTSGYGRSLFGRGQIIIRERESGVLWGGSDPRADGLAMSLA